MVHDVGKPSRLRTRLSRVTPIFLLPLLLSGLLVRAQENESVRLDVHGQKTWTIQYGIGDPLGLASAGLAPYQLGLQQTLAVDISAEALSILTVKAHFSDQEPPEMQSLTVTLDADELQGVFGDFSLTGSEGFAVYNRKFRGIRLDYGIGGATLSGILSQIEGIPESKTFVGKTAHEETLFSRTVADRPWLDAPYLQNIEGLYHYRLANPYVDGFSQVSVAFDASEGLRGLLATYSLEYLFDGIEEMPAEDLTAGTFVVVTNDSDFILLKREPVVLVRSRLKAYILEYNDKNDLTGDEKKKYPFNVDTDYERVFLDRVAAFLSLVVDDDAYPLLSAERRRFYDVGHTDLQEDSVVVLVSLQGGTFRETSEPDLADYRVTPHPEEGIVEFLFPVSFFEDARNQARVSYDYAISGALFQLGLSLVPGSEQVTLNDKLLVRDADYTIDYEVGALALLVKVNDTDRIVVNYERYRGGLGSSAEYASYFYGARAKLPLSEAITVELSVLESADAPTPLVEADQARTMPNRHTVAGLVGTVRMAGFSADVAVGLGRDVFPFDDNERTNLPNEISDLLVLPEYVFASDFGGVSVYVDGTWTHYDTSEGLSGSRVYDMASDGERVFFATASGLTVLSLEGDDPLAQVADWHRYYLADGLPDQAVRAVLVVGGTLWVGTEDGLAAVAVAEIDDPSSWRYYTDEPLASMGKILALAGDATALYMAAEEGLFRLDLASGEARKLSAAGLEVEALLLDGGTLYAAGGLGIRSFRDGQGTGWTVFGVGVHSLAVIEGDLWYGTDDGLHRASGGAPLVDGWAVTALAQGEDGAVWIGSRADADYRILVWREDENLERFESEETGIDGRDLSHFADISAEGHTDEGILSQISFRRDMGSLSVSGSFENVSPQFTSIGQLSRSDSTGWELTATAHPSDGLSIDLSHSYRITDAHSGLPTGTLQDKLILGWDFGPRLDFSLASGLADEPSSTGFDTSSLSYTVSLADALFGQALSIAVRWSDALSADAVDETWRRDNSLSFSGTWKASPALTIAADWSRPTGSSNGGTATGTETLGITADWAQVFASLQMTGHYAGSASRTISGTAWHMDHEARLGASMSELDAVGLRLAPSVEITAGDEEGVLSATGYGTLRATLQRLTVRGTYSLGLSGIGEARQQRSDRLNVSVDFSGFPDLRPNLAYSESSSAVIYEGEARPRLSRSLTGRLMWTPDKGSRNDLSIALRGTSVGEEGTFSASVRDSFFYALSEVLSSRIDLEGGYEASDERSDLDVSLRASADVSLSQVWRASLSASYLTGLKSSGALFHSLLFELVVAATF
jgi:hypothetical protein